jgi:phospholipid transport system substrate-binding protein
MKTNSNRVFALALAASLLIAGPAPAESGPEDKIRSTVDSVVEVLTDEALSSDQKVERLKGQLDACCMFETTSKLVLARNWKSFSPEQQTEFVDLFKRYLIATYGKNVDSYAGETVEIIGSREETRGDYTVQTRIDRGGGDKDLLVDYRLRKDEGGEWRIIDVIGEGISLVANLRSQLQEVMSSGGPEKVLDTLRKKADENDAENEPEEAFIPDELAIAMFH